MWNERCFLPTQRTIIPLIKGIKSFSRGNWCWKLTPVHMVSSGESGLEVPTPEQETSHPREQRRTWFIPEELQFFLFWYMWFQLLKNYCTTEVVEQTYLHIFQTSNSLIMRDRDSEVSSYHSLDHHPLTLDHRHRTTNCPSIFWEN